MPLPDYQEFGKIYRLNREVIVTEKIDGTNGCVYVDAVTGTVAAGSRTRWLCEVTDGVTNWLNPDNHGFGAWVLAHAAELRELGHGFHYGEWWGAGVNKRYPNVKEKRFSLFNVSLWGEKRPACCSVVPVLCRGIGIQKHVDAAMDHLRICGSMADPGNMRPEGIVAFHVPSETVFKVTLEKDEAPKGA